MTDTRPFDPALFHDAAIDPYTAKLNAELVQLLTGQPKWWIVSAEAMHAARRSVPPHAAPCSAVVGPGRNRARIAGY